MGNQKPPDIQTGAGRVMGTVVGLAFAGIGLTVLVFMWAAPFGEFGSPPLFFRIFASFIAVVFVAIGGGGAVMSLKFRPPSLTDLGAAAATPEPSQPPKPVTGYVCPHCGAPLGDRVDVSPSGDVKCGFCGRWFNVHRQG
jgi:hypothetical protein